MSDPDNYKGCVELYEAGYYQRQISRMMGWDYTQVRRNIVKAIRRGDVTPHLVSKQADLRSLARHRGDMILGNIGDLGYELTRKQCEWVIEEAARIGCLSLSEYITEVIRDLYEENSPDADPSNTNDISLRRQ